MLLKTVLLRRGLVDIRYSLISITTLWTAVALGQSTPPSSHELEIVVVDSSQSPIAGATVELYYSQGQARSAATSVEGRVLFDNLPGANFLISVSKDGFQSVDKSSVTLAASHSTQLKIALIPKLQHKEQVEVNASIDQLSQNASGSPVATAAARELPSHPTTVADALPLLPGVVRTPQGALSISGGGEHRSALIVNSADVTDPATGQFGTTVPIDSVETLNVYQTPFVAEYGRFTAGLVSVETRRGTDNWKWEINDPFPDFRIRSCDLRGIMDATPRLNLEGPLIPGKLYFSEGFEYEVRKVPVITLPFPQNQETTQGINSFSQFDYIASSKQLITATVHIGSTANEIGKHKRFQP